MSDESGEAGVHGARREWLPLVWAVLLPVLLLGPALGPGVVLTYDMVWVPDLALRSDFLGVAAGLPRAVPSDAVVAVLDEVLPGVLLQKAVLLGSLVAGGLGVARWLPGMPVAARCVAIGVYQWSPFVAERLVMGHWTVLLGYGALPWVLLLGRRWRTGGRWPHALGPVLLVGSLSASAGLATAVALLAVVAGRAPRRVALAGAVLVATNAPWLVSGALHAGASTVAADSVGLFAPADEGSVPAPLAVLSLGGIWNTEVVPYSRTGLLGWFTLVVLLAGVVLGAATWARHLGRRDTVTLVACWGVGAGIALGTWAGPGAMGWVAEHVPGAAVVRDGSRMLLLCAPAVATLAGAATTRLSALVPAGAARQLTAAALVVLPVLLMPDARWGVDGRLQAVSYPDEYAAVREAVEDGPPGDALYLPLSSYRQPAWNHDTKVLDPLWRFLPRDSVASDVLVVSGTAVPGEDPRVRRVAEALAGATPRQRAAALAAEGIGIVVVDLEAPGEVPPVAGEALHRGPTVRVIGIDGARRDETPSGWVAAMTAAWVAFLAPTVVGAGAGAVALVRRRRRR